MKKLMYVKNLSPKQYRSKERIIELERLMKRSKTVNELRNALMECRKVWNYNFQTEELMNPDPNWVPYHEELYIKRLRDFGVYEDETEATKPTVINVVVNDHAEVVFNFRNNTFRWV